MFFETLNVYQWPGLVLLCTFALCIGSFINVVAYRLPIMLQRQWASESQHHNGPSPAATPNHTATFNLAQPRSHCPNCGEQLKVIDNLPLISWLWLKGRCRFCRSVISYRYPLVELGALALGLAVVAVHGYSIPSLFYCGLAWTLLALLLIDFDCGLLPDQITQPLLWAGLLVNALYPLVPILDAVLGAIFGYLSLWLVFWAFKLATGKDGMGYGDFKLLAALGAWLGWQALPQVLMAAALTGLVYALYQVVTGKQSTSSAIPFGPFLALAGWVAVLFHVSVRGVWMV
jgi:leader peptidase (prepilin peptidase)/N-methyltransferase